MRDLIKPVMPPQLKSDLWKNWLIFYVERLPNICIDGHPFKIMTGKPNFHQVLYNFMLCSKEANDKLSNNNSHLLLWLFIAATYYIMQSKPQ
jgi:hypothetical protein